MEDFDFDNVLIDEKLHKNILIYDISYNILIGLRALKFVCNLHAKDLCLLATISGFLFSKKLFIALAKSAKYHARIRE